MKVITTKNDHMIAVLFPDDLREDRQISVDRQTLGNIIGDYNMPRRIMYQASVVISLNEDGTKFKLHKNKFGNLSLWESTDDLKEYVGIDYDELLCYLMDSSL